MKNLIVISSVINTTKNGLSYTNTRSVYSSDERYEQTIKSIESCKKINDSEILFIETSTIYSEKEEKLKSLVDHYVNYSLES